MEGALSPLDREHRDHRHRAVGGALMSTLSEEFLRRIREAHTRRALSWGERIYLPAIAQGLWVTSVHFWRNLLLHLAHRLGLFRHIPASVRSGERRGGEERRS